MECGQIGFVLSSTLESVQERRQKRSMRWIIQRVSEASVCVDGVCISQIQGGYLILVGIGKGDSEKTADAFVRKMTGLRIFEDENGKTNLNLASVGGEILLVSQFTLYADCRKGNRPSFVKAGSPKHAEELYEYLIAKCEQLTGQRPQTGQFGALMNVRLTNHGPFTMIMDSEELGY